MYRSEFDHYNTLKLEDNILSASEVAGYGYDFLKDRVKSLILQANKRLKNIQLSVSEKSGLLIIATEGIKALNLAGKAKKETDAKNILSKFYLDVYPNAIAQYSGKNLSMVEFYDVATDPKSEVQIQRKAITEQLQTSSDFANDVPMREFDSKEMGALPTFITDNKEKIAIGLGCMMLGGLAYHVFKSAKK
jgi:hypothetical protein